MPRAQLLILEEISRISKAFVDLGVNKISIIGGEPLTRRNVISVFEALDQLDNLDDLTITTINMLNRLKSAGVSRINSSLDILKPNRFKMITGNTVLTKTLTGIDETLDAGFESPRT